MYRMVTRANNTIAVKKKKKYGIIYLKVAKRVNIKSPHHKRKKICGDGP